MSPAESNLDAARRQLAQVLTSAGFARNERLARFLQFVVDQHLAGRDAEIKESVIAVEVFGRAPDHDPKQDSIVRTEAARLRARLTEYYAGPGKDDALVIELPKGGYAPVFRSREPATSTAVPSPTPRLWLRAALVCGAIAAAGLGWWWSQPQAPISIAVLPLTNLSQDSDDYFTDGLTDEIIRNLGIIDGLAVRSQTSSFALKGVPRNVREAGRQLNADYVLEGSVLREGQHLRINAQLVRARDDLSVWSGRYDRDLKDVLAIQDEISLGIVNSLRMKLGRGRRRYEINTEVYDLYLHARANTIERGFAGINTGIGQLEAVVERDPSFAPAYADLAAAYATRSGQFAFDIPAEMTKMRAAADKALQLDPLLAQAHYAQGMILARDAQWVPSEREFRRALELDPNRSESHRNFATFLLLPLGRIDEAVREAYAALKADPLSEEVHVNLSYVLTSAGRYDEAADVCGKLPEEARSRHFCMGRIHMAQGRLDEAIKTFELSFRGRVPGMGDQVRGELGHAYARAGRKADAEKLAASTTTINPFNHALISAGFRDKDRTFEELNRAATGGPFRIGRALTFPEFAFLQGDPRVTALRKKVGLP